MNSQDIISKLIEYGVPENDAVILAAVGYGESGYNPEIEGDSGDSIGLFQINIPAHSTKLVSWTGSFNTDIWKNWLKNPENNIFAAAKVYQSQGLGAWTIYNQGSYKQYLGQNLSVAGTTENVVSETTQTENQSFWRRVWDYLSTPQGGYNVRPSTSLSEAKENLQETVKNLKETFNPFSEKNLKIILIILAVIFGFIATINLMKGGNSENA